MTEQEFLKRIGERLAVIRKERKMSQVDVCSRLKMDKTYLSAIENGKQNTTLGKVKEILEAMGSDVDELFRL